MNGINRPGFYGDYMQITRNMVATLEYCLSTADGRTIYSSQQRGPMVYLHGAGAILPGLEKALEGRRVGETIRVNLPPEEAFGQRDPRKIFPVPRSDFSGADDIRVGMRFRAGDGPDAHIVTVVAVGDDEVTVDANHPLAGQPVNVEVTVRDIRPATAEEIEHKHVCFGDGNCQHRGGAQ